MGFDNNVPGVQAAVSSSISPFSEKVTSVTLVEDTGLVIGNMLLGKRAITIVQSEHGINEQGSLFHLLLDSRYYINVLKTITPGKWFTLVVLNDGYFHVPVHFEHRRFLHFTFWEVCISLLSSPLACPLPVGFLRGDKAILDLNNPAENKDP